MFTGFNIKSFAIPYSKHTSINLCTSTALAICHNCYPDALCGSYIGNDNDNEISLFRHK